MSKKINNEGRNCNGCGNFLTWSNFTTNKTKLMGHEATCKNCKRKKRKYTSKGKQIKRYLGLYTQECNQCSQIKEYSKYKRHLSMKGGHHATCYECQQNKVKHFKGLPRETNPQTGEPYKRGEIKNGKYVFGSVSYNSVNSDWDKPYLPVRTLKLDQFIVNYAKATITRRNQYVKSGRLKSHSLTVEHLIDIFPKDMICPIFNIEMTFVSAQPNSVELDRVDRNYEYKDGNVAWISAKANRCKGDSTSEELLAIASWLESKGC